MGAKTKMMHLTAGQILTVSTVVGSCVATTTAIFVLAKMVICAIQDHGSNVVAAINAHAQAIQHHGDKMVNAMDAHAGATPECAQPKKRCNRKPESL